MVNTSSVKANNNLLLNLSYNFSAKLIKTFSLYFFDISSSDKFINSKLNL